MTLPRVIGIDFSGTVAAVGKAVKHVAVGDNVFGTQDNPKEQGTLAEKVVVPSKFVARLDPSVPLDQAGAIPTAALAADGGVQKLDYLKEGDKVLVIGGAGCVGACAVQMCLNRVGKAGLVIATGGSRNKEYLESLGATFVDYAGDERGEIERILGGSKVDAVFDSVGGSESYQLARTFMRKGGMCASAGGPIRNGGTTKVGGGTILKLFGGVMGWKLRSLFGGLKYHMVMGLSPETRLGVIADMMKGKKLEMRIDREFPLHEADKAHDRAQHGKLMGRVVVKVAK
uniref:Enoyl reductase (ER) domain-containing protein n=1 Tax=Palpitomonas bilix TaxID=652834 RepID=A0A7S3DB49_9EUKA